MNTKGFLILPLKIERRSDNNADEVGPGPAPSPCKTLSPTGLPSSNNSIHNTINITNVRFFTDQDMDEQFQKDDYFLIQKYPISLILKSS